MSEPNFSHVRGRRENGVLVMTVTVSRIQEDHLADDLRRQLLEAVAYHGATRVALDFAPVQYLTSTAFRPLISLHRKLRELNGRLVLCNLAPHLAEVLLVTRLISADPARPGPFEWASDVAAAIALLKPCLARMEQGVLVLTLTESRLQGEELADELTRELTAAVRQAGARRVVVDCDQVELISTAGIRPLMALAQAVKPDGRLVLCNLRPRVAEVLTVTRIIAAPEAGPALLEAAPTVADAIRRSL
jgi:stage II sporulation protein AA (anti-sigma F factor antagonist)